MNVLSLRNGLQNSRENILKRSRTSARSFSFLFSLCNVVRKLTENIEVAEGVGFEPPVPF